MKYVIGHHLLAHDGSSIDKTGIILDGQEFYQLISLTPNLVTYLLVTTTCKMVKNLRPCPDNVRFVPNTKDNVIVALKSEEVCNVHYCFQNRWHIYVTADQKISNTLQFEGLEFI